MEAIQSAAFEVLISIALVIISLLGALGSYYITKAAAKVREQTAQIGDEKQRGLLENALADVETLAAVTVGAIEQTTASALREAVKNGEASREELLVLGIKAFNDIKAKVGPNVQAVITKNLGSFDDYLHNLIETKVLALKASTGQMFGEAIVLDADAGL